MAQIIWQWNKGNKKIFTRRIDIVDQAMKEGYYVLPKPSAQRIFNPKLIY